MIKLARTLKKKIEEKTAHIAVIGLGYVGLPVAIEFAKNGFSVTGVDNSEHKIKSLKSGRSYVKDISSSELLKLVKKNIFTPTTDYQSLTAADCICLCVPTPLNKTKDPDVSYILNATYKVRDLMQRGQLVCLESTTYPGTTRELILPIFSEGGLRAGRDFFLAYSPERIDPGNKDYSLHNTPKIVSGITDACTELTRLLYSQIIESVTAVSSTEAAEMTKLLENTFRIVNIGLVNELAIMCDKLGIDVWEVINAAATKPFGYMKFYPGPGLGGHCIPVDPHYLSWKLRLLNYRARFIELAGEVNSEMPEYVVGKVTEGLNRFKKTVNGAHILLIGAAYKKDIDDVRESPTFDIFELLRTKGAIVKYHDPMVKNIKIKGKVIRSSKLTSALLKRMDCVVVVTDHSHINFKLVERESRLIVDTRNVFTHKRSDRIIRL